MSSDAKKRVRKPKVSVIASDEKTLEKNFEIKIIPTTKISRVERFLDTQNTKWTILPSNTHYGTSCFWCMRKIIPTGNITWIGIPISHLKDGTYLCEGSFCTHNRLSCVYAWYLRENERGLRDSIFSSSLIHLNSMYKKLYGEGPPGLEPAADFRLLNQNGGPLSSDEFDEATSRPHIVRSDAVAGSRQYEMTASPEARSFSQKRIVYKRSTMINQPYLISQQTDETRQANTPSDIARVYVDPNKEIKISLAPMSYITTPTILVTSKTVVD